MTLSPLLIRYILTDLIYSFIGLMLNGHVLYLIFWNYILCLNLQVDSGDDKSDFHSCCMYWMYPNLPWIRLFPRIVPDSKLRYSYTWLNTYIISLYLKKGRNLITIFMTYLDSTKCNSLPLVEYIIGMFFLVHNFTCIILYLIYLKWMNTW